MRLDVLMLGVLALIVPGLSQAQASFEILPFTPALLFPPGEDFLSVAADGRTVVGQFRRPLSFPETTFGARWDDGVGLTELEGLPPAFPESTPVGRAFGVSADGMTVVGAVSNGFGRPHAVAWDAAGLLTPIDGGLTGNESAAVDASFDGRVILGQDIPSSPGGIALGGFVWDATNGARGIKDMTGYTGTLVANAISDDGTTVTGLLDDPFPGSPNEAFRWTEADGLQRLGFTPQGEFSLGTAISGDGSTIVGISGAGPLEVAFKWTAGNGIQALEQPASPLPFPFDVDTRAFGASHDGSVIVGRAGNDAVVWSDRYGGAVRLVDLLVQLGAVGLDGWELFEAVDISADGTVITGWASNFSIGVEDFAFRAVIPEPTTALLMGFGLATMSAAYRRSSTNRGRSDDRVEELRALDATTIAVSQPT